MNGIGSVGQIALEGIRANLRGLDRTAAAIAAAAGRGAGPTALADSWVRAIEQRHAIEASTATLRHADRLLDTLLDALS
jgi:hypothetical protein